MDIRSRRVLTQGVALDSHDKSIENESTGDVVDRTELISPIFGQFTAQYQTASGAAPKKYDGSRKSGEIQAPSQEWLTWKFYRSAYIVPNIHKDVGGAQLSVSRFLRDITKTDSPRERNRLIFLQGNVGCGKTAFLNYVITKHGRSIFKEKNTWFLRYNVEAENTGDEEFHIEPFVSSICEKLVYVLKLLPKYHTKAAEKFEKINENIILLKQAIDSKGEIDLKEVFRSAVHEVSKVIEKRFLLILDNLDGFFHKDDRYLFIKRSVNQRDMAATNIHKVISEFYMGSGELSKLNSNILFVLRPESYLVLERSRDFYSGPENPYRNRANLYSLENVPWADVIKQRLELIDSHFRNIRPPSRRIQLQESFSELRNALESQLSEADKATPSIIGALRHLSNQGVRDVLDFFYNHSYITGWLSYAERPINFRRYISHKPIGLMAYVLGGKCRFSQVASKFPNIFLVNVGAVDQDLPSTSDNNWNGKADTDHEHSYWLKFAILLYVKKMNEDNRAVTLNEVTSVFCMESEEGKFGYPDLAVRLSLGSLCERNVSNILRPQKHVYSNGDLNISGLEVNDRGKYCITDVFHKFFYLQIIIDDWALPLPIGFRTEEAELDYSYFALESGYAEKAQKMIEQKASLVCKFLGLLEAARVRESERYAHVFQELSKNGIELPAMDDWLKGILDELEKLYRHLGYYSGGIDAKSTRRKQEFDNQFNVSIRLLSEIYEE